MEKHSDLTFITNEKDKSLLERFNVLIKDTEFFDVLVAYFYTSGFYAIYKSLENTKKIRILVGIGTDKQTIEPSEQLSFPSHQKAKEQFSDHLLDEMENSQDNKNVEEGVKKFLEWLKSGKLEIKLYLLRNIHAKLYIMSFDKDDRDKGRVITGSSNFTQSGLVDNLEFNVELKNVSDYEFARKKFNELWQDAIDIKDSYINTIQDKTWLNDSIKPYELYLKFLYEYFKDDLNQSDKVVSQYWPEGFKKLEYQDQAVLNAKKILNEYGGVFLSDVVGLGKTYMSAMLAKHLGGRSLVLAPPRLLDKSNRGSWTNVFHEFDISVKCESTGQLDRVIEDGTEKYDYVFIDEAHRFRTEGTKTYESLAQICRGKRVILVTATPLNNGPSDILSQIKLFQPAKNSNIPNVRDLESFFKRLQNKLSKDKESKPKEYTKVVKQNAKEIRERVLKYLMVRRTRGEIEKYFAEDLKEQNVTFPEVKDPVALFYKFNKEEDAIFSETIQWIGKKLKYARYQALAYYEKPKESDQIEIQSQRNLGHFMKVLLVKRLESSFYAFKKSIDRFIKSYESYLKEFKKGKVYFSKDHINKIFDHLEDGDEEAIQKLLNEGQAKEYPAQDFKKSFKTDLENDLKFLREIQKKWLTITRDPKLDEFIKQVFSKNSEHSVLKKNKLIVFTEFKETADYLGEQLNQHGKVLVSTGGHSSHSHYEAIIENFDAKARHQKEDYRILIATEVLSEGVNLHRSNAVINYDIPWNPTRLMQRVGRVNRVDTSFKDIYTFNFFPTIQADNIIRLKEIAKTKIQHFISLLGTDAKLLIDSEEIESHELFDHLNSKKTIMGEEEEESELKYLKIIKEIRHKDINLFNKIKKLPKKSRTAKKYHGSLENTQNQLLTFFRKGKLQKFFLKGEELDFMTSAKLLEAERDTAKEKILNDFYEKLEKNKEAFLKLIDQEGSGLETTRGQNSSIKLGKYLKIIDKRQLTEEQEDYLKTVIERLNDGSLPEHTIKVTLKDIETECKKAGFNSLKMITVLQKNIAQELLKEHIVESSVDTKSPKEVVLSEYLIKP